MLEVGSVAIGVLGATIGDSVAVPGTGAGVTGDSVVADAGVMVGVMVGVTVGVALDARAGTSTLFFLNIL